jgi:hypothetical protein
MQKDFKTEQDAFVKHCCPRPNLWHKQTDRAKTICPRIFDSGQLKWRTTQVMIKLFNMTDAQKWRTTSDNKLYKTNCRFFKNIILWKKIKIIKINDFNFLCVMHKFLLSLLILSQNFESVKSSEGFIFLVIQIHFLVHRSKTFSHLARLVQIMKISLQLGGRFRGRSDWCR